MKKFIKSAIACVAAAAMIVTAIPVTTSAASKKAVVVSTQAQLEKAIKNGATKVTIKTSKNVKITIPASKEVAKISFVVNAKNAAITNKSKVQSLTITDAKTFTERGKNNDIKITDKSLTLTVSKESKGADISIAKTNANVKVVANGKVSSVTVDKKASVKITGSSDKTIDVMTTVEGAKVTTAVPVSVTANAKATIVIAKGADNSTITANADIDVSVSKGATVASVEVAAEDVKVDLTAKGNVDAVKILAGASGAELNITASGKVDSVIVDAKADVAVAGSTNDAVKVTVNAADTTVKADTTVQTTLNADAKVDLGAGAEGSKVELGSDAVKADVTNGTNENVTITDSTGKDSTVESGKTETSQPAAPTTPTIPSNGGSTGGNGGSDNHPSTPDQKPISPDPAVEALKDVVSKAAVYKGYVSANDYLSLDHLQVNADKTEVSVTFTADNSCAGIKKIYDKKRMDNQISGGAILGADGVYKEAVQYAIDAYVMNTFARYMGALHYCEDGNENYTVNKVKYGTVEYGWNTGNAAIKSGSNWDVPATLEDGTKRTTSLVSAVTKGCNSAIRNVEIQLVDKNGKTTTVKFKADVQVTVADTGLKYGKVEEITKDASIINDASANVVVECKNATLTWYPADPTIGRNSAGWWVGIKVNAPSSLTSKTDCENIKYGNKSGSDWSVKSFWNNQDSDINKADAPRYITMWGRVTKEWIKQWITENRGNIVYRWRFDWDQDGTYEQQVTLSFDPKTITLKQDGQLDYKYSESNASASSADNTDGINVESETSKSDGNAGN